MKSNKTIPTQILILLILLVLVTIVKAQKPSDNGSSEGGVSLDGSSNVSPSMSVVIIVLVLGFFITGCISIYIQHCVDSSSSSTSVTATRAIANRNTNHGLDQSVIDTFPVFPYSAVKELKIGKGALECAVCLSEFEEEETLRFLPKCDHVFHADCIDTWLQGHTTCPVCRDNLIVVAAPSIIDPDNQESSTAPISLGSEVRVTINDDENNETTSSLPKKLPRAHSTGHSLIQAGENCERYTLRLPAEVRRQLLARTKLKRATSLMTLPRQTSSRRGYRGGGGGGDGSGSSRYGRFFGRSFLMRVASFRSTVKIGVDGDLTTGGKLPKACSTDHSFPPPLPV